MITRYDAYVGGPSSCEYEVNPVFHEANNVPVRKGYLCIRRVTLHRFNVIVNIWGHYDYIPLIWRSVSTEANLLAELVIRAGDFMVAFTQWMESLRQWKVDPSVSEQCENELLDAISRFPNRWLDRYNEQQSKKVGTQVPGKK